MKRLWAVALIRWLLGLALLGAVAAGVWTAVSRWLWPVVTVTHPVQAPVVEAFYATGTLQPDREYSIRANNPGRITQVLVDKGSRVKEGQPLVVVSEDVVQFRFEQTKAERELKAAMADEKTSPALMELDARISAARELLEIAYRERDRVKQMFEQGAAAQADYDRALDRAKTLWAEHEGYKAQRTARKLELVKDLEVAEAALRIARFNLERQTVQSPIDGVVLDRPLSVGTRIAVNDRIMQVADVRPEKLIMRAAVEEEDRTRVDLGQLVRMTFYAYGDRVFEGKVVRVYDKADPDRRTFEIDVEMVEKDPKYAAGMTGELAFIVEQKAKALVIPSQALQAGEVWVVRDGRLARAKVKIGLRSVERVEALLGLDEKDQVVISPIEKLAVEQRVRTVFMDPTTAAGLNKPKQEKAFGAFR